MGLVSCWLTKTPLSQTDLWAKGMKDLPNLTFFTDTVLIAETLSPIISHLATKEQIPMMSKGNLVAGSPYSCVWTDLISAAKTTPLISHFIRSDSDFRILDQLVTLSLILLMLREKLVLTLTLTSSRGVQLLVVTEFINRRDLHPLWKRFILDKTRIEYCWLHSE